MLLPFFLQVYVLTFIEELVINLDEHIGLFNGARDLHFLPYVLHVYSFVPATGKVLLNS